MFRIFGDRPAHQSVAANSDKVMIGVPLPAGSVLNNLWLDFHVIGGETPVQNMSFLGITGYILPVLDPDNEATLSGMWDIQVPKSDDMLFTAGSDSLDSDSATTAVTTPDVDPGELSLNFIDVGMIPKRILAAREWISFASSPTGFEGAAENIFRPTYRRKFHIGKRFKVQSASYALIAISSPALTETTNAGESTLPEQDWVLLQFMQYTLKQAWTQMVGLTQTGAELPWSDALKLVERITQPDLLEGTAGRFAAQTWEAYCIGTFDISVPGDLDKVALSGR